MHDDKLRELEDRLTKTEARATAALFLAERALSNLAIHHPADVDACLRAFRLQKQNMARKGEDSAIIGTCVEMLEHAVSTA